jgi:hypothetical protein
LPDTNILFWMLPTRLHEFLIERLSLEYKRSIQLSNCQPFQSDLISVGPTDQKSGLHLKLLTFLTWQSKWEFRHNVGLNKIQKFVWESPKITFLANLLCYPIFSSIYRVVEKQWECTLIFICPWNSRIVNISFTKALSVMSNDPAQPIASWFKYHLKVLKSDIISQFLKCREKFFQALQITVFQLSFEIFENSKVARTDVRRVGWTRGSENLQAT